MMFRVPSTCHLLLFSILFFFAGLTYVACDCADTIENAYLSPGAGLTEITYSLNSFGPFNGNVLHRMSADGYIYYPRWDDVNNNYFIHRLNPDGAESPIIPFNMHGASVGRIIAIDPASQFLYFTDLSATSVRRLNLQSQEVDTTWFLNQGTVTVESPDTGYTTTDVPITYIALSMDGRTLFVQHSANCPSSFEVEIVASYDPFRRQLLCSHQGYIYAVDVATTRLKYNGAPLVTGVESWTFGVTDQYLYYKSKTNDDDQFIRYIDYTTSSIPASQSLVRGTYTNSGDSVFAQAMIVADNTKKLLYVWDWYGQQLVTYDIGSNGDGTQPSVIAVFTTTAINNQINTGGASIWWQTLTFEPFDLFASVDGNTLYLSPWYDTTYIPNTYPTMHNDWKLFSKFDLPLTSCDPYIKTPATACVEPPTPGNSSGFTRTNIDSDTYKYTTQCLSGFTAPSITEVTCISNSLSVSPQWSTSALLPPCTQGVWITSPPGPCVVTDPCTGAGQQAITVTCVDPSNSNIVRNDCLLATKPDASVACSTEPTQVCQFSSEITWQSANVLNVPLSNFATCSSFDSTTNTHSIYIADGLTGPSTQVSGVVGQVYSHLTHFTQQGSTVNGATSSRFYGKGPGQPFLDGSLLCTRDGWYTFGGRTAPSAWNSPSSFGADKTPIGRLQRCLWSDDSCFRSWGPVTANRWTRMDAGRTSKRSSMGIIQVSPTYFFIVGGRGIGTNGQESLLNDVWSVNVADPNRIINGYEGIAPFSPRAGAVTGYFTGYNQPGLAGHAVIVGGIDHQDQVSNDIWIMAIDSRGFGWWSQTSYQAGFAPRAYAAATMFEDKLFISGGADFYGAQPRAFNDLWVMFGTAGFPTKQVSVASNSINFSPRYAHGMAAAGRVLYIFGGAEFYSQLPTKPKFFHQDSYKGTIPNVQQDDQTPLPQ